MKSFYAATAASPSVSPREAAPAALGAGPGTYADAPRGDAPRARARVAVYDAPAAAPRVIDLEPAPIDDYIESLAATVYRLSQEQGGDIPYSVIREVTENLIHADFADPVVSVMDSGRTVRFADRGPGITDKDRAILPGYTTASGSMKRYIRGVGSGLPIVLDYMRFSGGRLEVDDNLGSGTVVTLSSAHPAQLPAIARSATSYSADPAPSSFRHEPAPSLLDTVDTHVVRAPVLTTRQKQVLALVMESGSAGPSLVSKELGVGISTAYRDLASLEDMGLIVADGGKRALTEEGLSYLDSLTTGS